MKLHRFDLPVKISLHRFLKEHHWDKVSAKLMAKFLLALHLAESRHWEQTRNDGDAKYIEHLIVVVFGLYRLGFNVLIEIVGILHDIVEDGVMTIEEVKKLFGGKVARMVAAMSKDKKNEAGYFDQLYRGTALDFELIFVKLVDRWHNLITVYGFRDNARQIRFLEETVGPMGDLLKRCRPLIPKERIADYDWLVKTVITLAEAKLQSLQLLSA